MPPTWQSPCSFPKYVLSIWCMIQAHFWAGRGKSLPHLPPQHLASCASLLLTHLFSFWPQQPLQCVSQGPVKHLAKPVDFEFFCLPYSLSASLSIPHSHFQRPEAYLSNAGWNLGNGERRSRRVSEGLGREGEGQVLGSL